MTTPDFRTKAEFAFIYLRNAIISGRIPSGEWVRVDDWANRLEVSQTPVREALSRLEAQGLVAIHPHRGAQVMERTPEHVRETYLMRAALESLAARTAIERADDQEFAALIDRLTDLTHQMEWAAKADDLVHFSDINQSLHMALYAASGLPRLVALIEILWATYPFVDSLGVSPGRLTSALREHEQLLDAVRGRDAGAVEAAVAEHLRAAEEQLQLHFQRVAEQPKNSVTAEEPAAS
ncbi:MAG: GntR family transcriptional regulator [Dehalococcoidia bacterium]